MWGKLHPSGSSLRQHISRTLVRTLSSDQPPWLMKCNIDFGAETRSGAVTAAIGSTLLCSQGSNSPVQ